MAELTLKQVSKVYDDGYQAVSSIDMAIQDKEFIVLVGPSGCGKSTTLRMIAGLEDISDGEMYIGDQLVNHIPPKERDIAMVFQSYALYPHMNVRDNMAFAMKMHGVGKEERYAQVEKVAEVLQLTDLLDRKPAALSGGQRQRVALGRAMVRNPKVFLLDEPLSNLDAKLRVSMRSEIVRLHRELETTFIYVTHDQTEAMTMGTRIAVLNQGKIEQFDTPSNLYYHPANTFVAEFIGSPQMNMINAKLVQTDQGPAVTIGQETYVLDPTIQQRLLTQANGQEVIVGIRPENMHYSDHNKADSTILVQANNVEQVGSDTFVYFDFEAADRELTARFNPPVHLPYNAQVYIDIDMSHLLLFDKESGKTLLSNPILQREI